MDKVFLYILEHYGTLGVGLLAAGYVAWNSYQKATQMKQQQGDISDSLIYIRNKVQDIDVSSREFRGEISKRMDTLEQYVEGLGDEYTRREGDKLLTISKIGASIHNVLNSCMDDCNADHTFVALLHNGTNSITGVPFLKFDIVAERFYPIENSHDYEIASLYKDADIMIHGKLPSILLHEGYINLIVDENLYDIDPILFARCHSRSIKQLVLKVFKNADGYADGFVGAYSFDDRINEEEFRNMARTISTIYKDFNNNHY